MNTTSSQTSNQSTPAEKQALQGTKNERTETPEQTAVKQQQQQGSSNKPDDKSQSNDNGDSPQKKQDQPDKPKEAAPHNQK